MFGALRKDLSLIDNVTERSVWYVYSITNPTHFSSRNGKMQQLPENRTLCTGMSRKPHSNTRKMNKLGRRRRGKRTRVNLPNNTDQQNTTGQQRQLRF